MFSDVQVAINAAADGDTVIIPNGTCTWDSGVTTTKQIKIQGQTKGSVKLVMGAGISVYDTALIHFTTGGGTMKLFTMSGHKVAELSESGGAATWNLKNDSGEKVASGIYVYLITDGRGAKVRGKVGIVR
jgi:hypothetical protein